MSEVFRQALRLVLFVVLFDKKPDECSFLY